MKELSDLGTIKKAILSQDMEEIRVIGDVLEAKKITEKSWFVIYKKDDTLIASYGFGAPSLAVIVEELLSLGVRCIVKIDKCKALNPTLRIGDIVVIKASIPNDGFTRSRFHYGFPACADPHLFVTFEELGKSGICYTTDLYYGKDEGVDVAKRYGVLCLDYSTSALYTLANYYNVKALSLCVISENVVTGERGRVEDVSERLVRLGIDVFNIIKKVKC